MTTPAAMETQPVTNDDAETFTQRCRRMLTDQPSQGEFTLSRAALEVLVADSERYAESNAASNELLLTARKIMSETTMMSQDADAWTRGSWDSSLPRELRSLTREAVQRKLRGEPL